MPAHAVSEIATRQSAIPLANAASSPAFQGAGRSRLVLPTTRHALRGTAVRLPGSPAKPRLSWRVPLRPVAAGMAIDEEAVEDYWYGVQSKTPFRKILVANRGEIAIRVCRAGTELGLRTVAIYSRVDRMMPHRYKADESYEIGNQSMTPVQCYLDIEGIISLAKKQGVDSIHPGYGFLSENATFAKRCEEEGITFIGPRSETIQSMGDKTDARKLAIACGVPVVPGTDEALLDTDAVVAFAKEAGFPVILKAAMGGGGRGMRVVRSEEELIESFKRASNEAKGAFGDGRMFVEKYVERPRHIEVQILADHHGNVIHLHERDCSVQRRHQKVVEIAPAPGLSPAVRAKLHADAVKLAKHVGYRNAGTVEFMVCGEEYYFLEVNPRIQVEHTVTEEVTGIDLVQSQIMVAGGASLADLGFASQEDVPPPYGYAIQGRVTSENPEMNFQPDTGRIEAYSVPGGPGIRIDGSLGTGNIVTPYYDSMLCKLIAKGPTFESAVTKMDRGLQEFFVRGIRTNIPFLLNVLRHPEFTSGTTDTSFIERHPQLFSFDTDAPLRSNKLLMYLADQVVNGPNHPGASGPRSSAMPIVPDTPISPPPPGWSQIYREQGADAWAKAVRKHKGMLLTDTTMRDAHQSLLATRMRTYDMLKVARPTAHLLSECASLEMWGGATFDVSLRFLKECPWERLELLKEEIPNIPFQMLIRGANAVGYTSYPDNVVYDFVRMAQKTGVDIFRVFDSLNYIDNLKFGIDTVYAADGICEGTICYTGDVGNPNCRYNLEYYLNLAEQMVDHGIHALAIKDMAGLLKPRSATLLVSTLRERFPDLPIHVHTHDTAGTGVATQLACAYAGADIIDAAIDSMSGLTSQPSMGAIVHNLKGTELDTGIAPAAIDALGLYWEGVREVYSPFEGQGLKGSSSDVYSHEMPGGQYTNLKFQALSLGLGNQWPKVKKAYHQANMVLGDLVKVTPSSKVVGDLAQFMVQNNLNEASVVEQAESLSFPSSVVEFMQGYLGQPPFGFPEPLRTRMLKGKEIIEGRPGASIKPGNLIDLKTGLQEKWGRTGNDISERDVLSAAMYPKVFDEYRSHVAEYSELTSKLSSTAFFHEMEEDDEVEVELFPGNSVVIKFKAIGEIQPNGKREVFFETNGIPRIVEIVDRQAREGTTLKAAKQKHDPSDPGSVGAPMGGEIVEIMCKPGTNVAAGTALVVMSAMKMETTVSAPVAGIVKHVAVEKGDSLDGGDLLVSIKTPNSSMSASGSMG
mmetsp:Transcript_38533/g.108941  ORF Transcript_38533/g.108941 Transcript_38533/m.108941 type:complete len:1254 (+) Transcript_38533:126-3887(+)